MLVLLDTNVLVSGILFRGTPRALVRMALQGEIDVVTSPHLLQELQRLLEREFAFSGASAAAVRSELEATALVVVPRKIPRVCRDPDDDQVLAAAFAGDVEVLATGDADLLVLHPFRGIDILSPTELLARLPGTG